MGDGLEGVVVLLVCVLLVKGATRLGKKGFGGGGSGLEGDGDGDRGSGNGEWEVSG